MCESGGLDGGGGAGRGGVGEGMYLFGCPSSWVCLLNQTLGLLDPC